MEVSVRDIVACKKLVIWCDYSRTWTGPIQKAPLERDANFGAEPQPLIALPLLNAGYSSWLLRQIWGRHPTLSTPFS